MIITREMMKNFVGNYDEAVDMLLSVVNKGTDQDDIIESIEYHFIDNGLMSEQEFRKETNG